MLLCPVVIPWYAMNKMLKSSVDNSLKVLLGSHSGKYAVGEFFRVGATRKDLDLRDHGRLILLYLTTPTSSKP